MLSKLALINISFIMLSACTADANQQKSSIFTNTESGHNTQSLTENPYRSNSKNSQASKSEKLSVKESNQSNIVAHSPNSLQQQGNYMTLEPTEKENGQKNPIYKLTLFANGQPPKSFEVVSGRSHTQDLNRHMAGTEAPLPDGEYQVANSIVPGTHPEVGGRFLPIYPKLPNGRSALGIHWDPSFNKKNGEDGTAGCIGLTNKPDLDQVLNYVREHKPQFLEVDIQ